MGHSQMETEKQEATVEKENVGRGVGRKLKEEQILTQQECEC